MARILGITLPDDKRLDYALTLLYGIGWPTSRLIIKNSGVGAHIRVGKLSEEEIKKLISVIDKTFKIEGELKEEIVGNINRKKEINSYIGVRHARGLPAHGQRTRSNARTKRGKRKTVGALKKEVWAKLEQQKPAKEAA